MNLRETLKSFLVWMFIAIHKRESGIPSNRGSRHGEFVNKLVHTARTLWKWGGNEDGCCCTKTLFVYLEKYNLCFVASVKVISIDSFFRTEVKS